LVHHQELRAGTDPPISYVFVKGSEAVVGHGTKHIDALMSCLQQARELEINPIKAQKEWFALRFLEMQKLLGGKGYIANSPEDVVNQLEKLLNDPLLKLWYAAGQFMQEARIQRPENIHDRDPRALMKFIEILLKFFGPYKG
jgi:hypothetical protein